MLKKVSIFLTSFLLLSSTAFASWTVDSLSFDKRKVIHISRTNVGATLTDFPVLVKFADTDIGAVSNADGFDIRFTTSDGSTLCKYERESFAIATGTATGIYWVKIPSVSTSADTDFYVYYRNTDTADGADKANVWDDNFKAVFHLSETPAGNAGEIIDSNGVCSGVANGGATMRPTRNTGFINYGLVCDTNDYFEVTSPTNLGSSNRTVSIHYKPNGSWTTANDVIFDSASKGFNVGIGTWQYGYTLISPCNTGFTTPAVSNNTWHRITIAVNANGTINAMYFDATAKSSSYSNQYGTNGNYIPHFLGQTGTIDEIRVSNIIRSSQFVVFEYYNMTSATNELTWGAEESGAVANTSNFFSVF